MWNCFRWIFIQFLFILIAFRNIGALCFSVGQWWKFAIDCHLSAIRDQRMRCQWQFAVSRAHDIVQYIEAYRSCLTVGSRYITRAQKVLYVTCCARYYV